MDGRITLLLHTLVYLMVPTSGKWYEINGTEFYLTTYSGEASYTWAESQRKCWNMGAYLTSIHSQAEMDQIMLWSEEEYWYNAAYWLGFNDLDRQGYVWSDSSVVDYKNWQDGWPLTDNLGRYCTFTNPKSDGVWFNEHCGREKGFICRRPADEKPSTITTPATTPVPGYCPRGYFDAGNKCFKIVTLSEEDGATFEEAVDRCRRETTDGIRPNIACIHNEYENAIITSQMQEFQIVGMWIGLTQQNGANWLWVDNKDWTYLNWAPSMPERYRGECVEMVYRHPPTGHTGTWYNAKCGDKRGFVCQVEKDPAKVVSTPQSTTTNICPDDYVPYNKGCYKLMTEAKIWSEANETCINSGAHLVSVHSDPENAAVLTLWSHLEVEDIWIGLYDKADQVFHWTDSWYVMYTRWDDKEPSEVEEGGCVVMGTDGKWSNKGCKDTRPFICKTTTAPPITTPAHGEGKCPKESGWVPFGDYCYKFERDDRGDWLRAQEKCLLKHEHAQLASVHDPVENDFIFKNMLATNPWADAWIGLFRGKNGEFQWVDGTFLQYTHWMPGAPEDGPTDKLCVLMSMKEHPKLWIDTTCSYNEGYICKAPKRKLPTPPPDIPGTCPIGWKPYGSHCYWFEPDMFSFWSGAQEVCLQKGGVNAYIASVYYEHENDFIHEEMMKKNNLPKTRNYWLGGKKNGIGKPYHWQNGENLTVAFWARDYPQSDPNGILNCVEVDFDTGLWKNTVCDNIRGLVCKVPKEALHSTTTEITTTTELNSTSSPTTSISGHTTERSDPLDTGIHGGSVAAIILAVVLAVIICLHAAFAINKYWKTPQKFTRFVNPVSDHSQSNMSDYGTRSVEFRHGSTMSKDHVILEEAEGFEQEQNNDCDP